MYRYPTAYKACTNKSCYLAEMIHEGVLCLKSRRNLSVQEELEWNFLCNEIGPVPILVDDEDNVSWLGEECTVNKGYELQLQEDTPCNFDKFLWKSDIPYKISFMLWENFHDSLPTLCMLEHRGVNIQNTICSLCNREEETKYHIFLRCDLAKQVFDYFVKACHVNWNLPAAVFDLFQYWKGVVLNGKMKEVLEELIYAILWHLWKTRNNMTFGGKKQIFEEVCLNIKQSIIRWCFEKDIFRGYYVSQFFFNWETVLHL
ncbi:uncharacterized protein LOC113280301 [Papaver somniferum]|uniref:uncharacterized protein LOC113280301 n=1 Tax=Papaver somniferum TaxID=3469 RepID=UPI000E6F9F93|nr:uncharacterized protein LOC113280301 [Papaver somniferum]